MNFSERFQHKMNKINRQGSMQQIKQPPSCNPERTTKLKLLHSVANSTGPSLQNLNKYNKYSINKTNSFSDINSVPSFVKNRKGQIMQIRTQRKSSDSDLQKYLLKQKKLINEQANVKDRNRQKTKSVLDYTNVNNRDSMNSRDNRDNKDSNTKKNELIKKQYYEQNDFLGKKYIDIMLQRHSKILKILDKKTKWQ